MAKEVIGDMRNSLRRISRDYEARLRPETRRRILNTARQEAADGAWAGWRIMSFAPQVVAAGLVFLLLALPALVSRDTSDIRTPVRDLEVRAEGSKVVLTWSDGGQPRKIVRATSREELANLDETPGITVNGERWVDDRSVSEDEPIVYYYVE